MFAVCCLRKYIVHWSFCPIRQTTYLKPYIIRIITNYAYYFHHKPDIIWADVLLINRRVDDIDGWFYMAEKNIKEKLTARWTKLKRLNGDRWSTQGSVGFVKWESSWGVWLSMWSLLLTCLSWEIVYHAISEYIIWETHIILGLQRTGIWWEMVNFVTSESMIYERYTVSNLIREHDFGCEILCHVLQRTYLFWSVRSLTCQF